MVFFMIRRIVEVESLTCGRKRIAMVFFVTMRIVEVEFVTGIVVVIVLFLLWGWGNT